MSLSYPSRFVELQSVPSHYDEKYPPDYEQATSTGLSDTSSIRPPNTGTIPSAAWPGSPSPFADPVQNARRSPEHQIHSRAYSVRRPLPSPRPQSSQANPAITATNTLNNGPTPTQSYAHGRTASVSQISVQHTGQSYQSTQSQLHSQSTGNGHVQFAGQTPAAPTQRQGLTGNSGEYERYVYTYRLVAAGAPVQVLISVESSTGLPTPGKYTFRLSTKVGGIERPMCEAVQKTLRVDPRRLEFVVFMFPGKSSLPSGCLWSLRVWLRVNNIDHRLFGEDELWVGKDPDFNAIGDASFGRIKHQDTHEMVYQVYAGRAPVLFSIKWSRVQGNLYKYSMDYEAGGVGGMVFQEVRLKLDIDPRSVGFLIFTVPSNSVPPGASHKLRVWLRTIVPLSPTPHPPSSDPQFSGLPFNDSYLYQRLYKTDDFKVGAHLQFESLGPKMIMAFHMGGPEAVRLAHPPHSGGSGSGGGGKVGRGHSGSLSSVEEAKKERVEL